ncbi:MAG TPA: AAA family ATPase [Propionibacteriaceae bacterium]|nr:AAA family ATPase [Propionibacteriaceae bacterium]
MGELVVVTGPPGAGKSSVSEQLVNRRTPSALVAGDVFFAMIKQGYILPWLPESHQQNEIIIEAAAAAAGRLTEICFVVFDGVVGPWLLPTFERAAGLPDLHYVVLLPPLDVCLERVRTRVDHGFTDLSVTRDMHRQFVDAHVDSRHLITKAETHPAGLAELIDRQLDGDQFRYSPSL